MATTITVSEGTRRMLERLKKNSGARSFDDLLAGIAMKELAIPGSLFGGVRGISREFRRDHEERL